MQRRLFFALPAQQLSNALQHSQQQLLPEGYLKPVPAENFHLTLHFLGLQDDSILPSLYQAAAQIQSPAFTLQLDRYGLFRHAHCLWLGPQHPAPELCMLVEQLSSALAQLNLPISADYRPHITLSRNAKTLPNQPAPTLQLPVSEFILYESVSGNHGLQYRPLQHWSLLNQLTGKKRQ
ncbi:MAG: RNA 2',3'-cyclic phosphodiesterase [Tolumonas sp.]|nr:RNA 2',3'-cyclic phosphodiesterase [Tolumonas sp.]